MSEAPVSPAVDHDRLKTLVDYAFNDALYLHYQWPALTDRETALAEFCVRAAHLADMLPPDVVSEAKVRITPPEKSTVEKEVGVKQAYQDWAATYDQSFNPLIVVEEPHMLNLIGDVRGKTVADISCGTGRYSRYVVSQGASSVHGVDMSAAMLNVAREHSQSSPAMTFAQGSFDTIPLASGHFDVVICALALEYATDLNLPMREFARLLKPGGTLIVSDFHPTLKLMGTRNNIHSYVHFVQEYFEAAKASSLRVTSLREPTVGELPAEFAQRMTPFVRAYGHVPFVLILKAEKQ